MSLNRLARDQVMRRMGGMRQEAAQEGDEAAGAAPDLSKVEKVDNVLSSLVKYIPTEAVTLYVGAVSAAPALQDEFPLFTPKVIYWTSGLGLTPLILLLIYFAKRRAAGLPFWPGLTEWPYWRLTAAVVAFLVWALAVPTNPYVTTPAMGVIAAFLAILISTLLSLIERIVEPKVEAA